MGLDIRFCKGFSCSQAPLDIRFIMENIDSPETEAAK